LFIIDDILLAPAKGFMWLVRELHQAAEREAADERAALMRRLQSLHMRLETGELDEPEFERQEAEILDRLETLEELESAR
jgi:hypothetical protein